MNREMPAIQGEGISFSYDQGEHRRQVLYNCDLTLYPGERVVLTGPSGAGKTTLLTLIGALRAMQSGTLKILGHELSGATQVDRTRLRGEIGFIFQNHNLIEALTAFDNVRLAMSVKSHYTPEDFRKRPQALLERLGLGPLSQVKPEKLSGGERQRVSVARALINNPRIILADEPTAALDFDNAQRVLACLGERAADEGCTLVIVTHDQRVMEQVTRVITMVDGRIVADEPSG